MDGCSVRAMAEAVAAEGGKDEGPGSRATGSSLGDGRKVSPSDIQLVQNLIERCLQEYMPKQDVVKRLEEQANIEPRFTTLVWQQLEKENPEFFWAYYLRLKVKEQIVTFNQMVEQQIQVVQKMQQRFMPPMLNPRPATPFPAVPPMGPVQMAVNGGQPQMGAQQQQPVAEAAVNPHMNIGSQAFNQPPAGGAGASMGLYPLNNVVQQEPIGVNLAVASASLNNVQDASSPLEPHGLFGSGPLALSSPLELEFSASLLNACSSPDLALTGTSGDLLLPGGGIHGTGTGSSNDLQSLVPNFSYQDISSLDLQVSSFMNQYEDGLSGEGMLDLPRINSLSDMTPLDLEALEKP